MQTAPGKTNSVAQRGCGLQRAVCPNRFAVTIGSSSRAHRPCSVTAGALNSMRSLLWCKEENRLVAEHSGTWTSMLQSRCQTHLSELALPCSSLGVMAAAAVLLSTFLAALPATAAEVVSIPGLVGDSLFREGAVSGFLLIFFSELGDKTFFIALLLALKQNRTAVFTGTFGALAIMTLISVGLGQVLHGLDELLPKDMQAVPFDDLFAAALLLFFGIKTLQEAKDAEEAAKEEREEAQEEVEKFAGGNNAGFILSTFALVFAAEWGDKSFLATIALSAASSPAGVVTGAVAGHGAATLLAVAGGSVLSKYVNERLLQYTGGTLFLVFAAATIFDIFVQQPHHWGAT